MAWIWVIYDLAILLVLVIAFTSGWLNGLMSALVRLVAFAASAVSAYVFSGQLAPFVYNSFIGEKIEEVINSIQQDMEPSAAFWYKIITAIDETAAPEQLIMDAVRLVIGVIIFIIVIMLLSLAARAFKGINKVPILGTVNKILGGVLGLAVGLIICLVLVSITAAVISVSGNKLSWMNISIIDKTYLFSYIYKYNFLQFI